MINEHRLEHAGRSEDRGWILLQILHEPLRRDLRLLAKPDREPVLVTIDCRNTDLLRETAEAGIVEQILDRHRQPAITITNLLANPAHLLIGTRRGNALIGAEPLPHVGNIVFRDARLDADIDLGADLIVDLFTTQFVDRSFEHLGIEVEANCLDVAGLLPSEKVPRPAQLEVERRDAETGPQIREFSNGRQTAPRHRGQLLLGRNEQPRIGPSI